LLHVPDPLLWGTVAMLANFIPYVGAIVTTTMLLLVGLMHFDDVAHAILPALCFAVSRRFEGNHDHADDSWAAYAHQPDRDSYLAVDMGLAVGRARRVAGGADA
jgi:hypothetical protein